MDIVTIDFETYYDREQSLSKMTTEAYLRDKRFEVIGVAIKINEDHGINLHDSTFMRDRDKMKKLKYILQTEYKHLLVNTQGEQYDRLY